MSDKSFSLLNPILDEKATKSRRFCIVMSLIALFIGLTEQVPSKILLLGLNFESTDEPIIVWFIFAITVVIFIDFICHAAPNILNFIATYSAYSEFLSRGGMIEGPTAAMEQYRTAYTKMGDNIPTDEYQAGEQDDDPLITRNIFIHKHNDKIIFMCWVRIGIEIAIPTSITAWALLELLQFI